MPDTFQSLISLASRRLTDAGVDSARLDIEVLLMHLMNIDRAHLYLKFRESPSPELSSRLLDLVERRAAGEPVAYLIGRREFMGLDFVVDPRVLIPRPETEGLVERALQWLERHPNAQRVADVGTGSGAIAISLDRFVPPERSLFIAGSDISRDALVVASVNRTRLGAERVALVNGSLLDWCRSTFDLIVANLPYLREEQRHKGISQEPDLALFTDDHGFALYAMLIPQTALALSLEGALMCEIDPDQEEVARVTARAAFPNASARIEQDLAGRNRYLIVERSS